MTVAVFKGTRTSTRGPAQLVPGLDVRAGKLIAARYRVEELLGSGPSGVVLSAKHILLRREVTLKILAAYTESQMEVVDRRVAKARQASRLRGAHVARIVDIGLTEDAMPYVASERAPGVTLEEEIAERGKLPMAEAVRWVLEACEGLSEAHAFGLSHGDLKPQNLFLADNPKGERVLKILDFGTTSPLDAMGEESASAFFGSPAFLAPEQIQDPQKADARADIWALGALLFHLMMGRPPFEAESVSGVLIAVVYDEPAALEDAPEELAALVAWCLEKDPAQRPRDVAELARMLAPFARAEGAEIAERAAETLAAAPPSPRETDGSDIALADVTASSSVAPVSMPSMAHAARPERTATTQRSRRVRRTRLRDIASGFAGDLRESAYLRPTYLAGIVGTGALVGFVLAKLAGPAAPSVALDGEAGLPAFADERVEAVVVPPYLPPSEPEGAEIALPPRSAPPLPPPMASTMFVPTPTIALNGVVTPAKAAPPLPPTPSLSPRETDRRRDEEIARKLFSKPK